MHELFERGSSSDEDEDAEDTFPSVEDLPELFAVTVGDYMGDSFSVSLEGDALIYKHPHEGPEPYRTERVRPSVNAWTSFERWLQVVDPWAWNGEYRLPPAQTVTDGTYLSLQLTWSGGQVEASGDLLRLCPCEKRSEDRRTRKLVQERRRGARAHAAVDVLLLPAGRRTDARSTA